MLKKLDGIFKALPVLLALGAGILLFKLWKESTSVLPPVTSQIETFKRAFIEENVSTNVLDFSNTPLINPENALPQTTRYPLEQLRELDRFAKNCLPPQPFPRKVTPDLQKAWVWHQYVCAPQKRLPEQFFSTTPYLHPSGFSYVYLAYRANRRTHFDDTWLRKTIAYAHAVELPAFPQALLSKEQILMAQLPTASLFQLSQGEEIILGEPFILWKNDSGKTDSNEKAGLYFKFPREMFDKALRKHSLNISSSTDETCDFPNGGLCWGQDTSFLKRQTRSFTFWSFLCLLSMIGAFIWSDRKKAAQMKQAETQRELVFHTLAHELRTPLSSLKLSLEEMRKEFDSLSESGQVAFLNLCDASQKLTQLADKSGRYITSDHKVLVQKVDICSLAAFVAKITEPYGNQLTVRDFEDTPARFDPHWLQICLGNVIENAFRHGKPPVHLDVEVSPQALSFTVEDSGQGNSSAPISGKGLGIGLKIVSRVLQEMEGSLEKLEHPTRYRLKLRRET